VERLLIRLPNWLGDVLLARPLLHGLSRARPSAALIAVAPAPLLELLQLDVAGLEGVAWPAGTTARRAATRTLRTRRPDAALVLPPSFSSAWLAWRSGAAVRVGYAHEGRAFLLTRPLPRPPRGEVHLSEEYRALGAALGELHDGPLPVLRLPAVALERAAGLAAGRGTAGYAVLGPGAIYGPAKRWPVERFAAVGRRLAARGLSVLACGGAAERDACEAVAAAVGPAARSLAGQTDLLALAGLCAGAAVAVCNDSGLAHLAAAVGAPTVVVFGSTSSAWTAPLGRRVRVVQRAPVCAPCFQRRCRIGYRCLDAVSAAEVAAAAEGVAA
jgi:heptosyltransferase-2